MKWILVTISLGLMAFSPAFAAVQSTQVADAPQKLQLQLFQDAEGRLDIDRVLNLSPRTYQELTGQRLTLQEKIQLRVLQYTIKKQMHRNSGISQGLYIVLAIFGLAWIAMGVMDNWSGDTWIINLLLTLLFWLPGFIHALIVMNRYY